MPKEVPTEKEIASNLVYAADISFSDTKSLSAAKKKADYHLREIINDLFETGITIKVNTLARFLGIEVIERLADAGFGIFADLKLFDVYSTVSNDISWLRLVPNLKVLTIAEKVKPTIFLKARTLLPDTIIAPVGPLTDLTDDDFFNMGEVSRVVAVRNFFDRTFKLPINGVVCSPTDIWLAPAGYLDSRILITPAIRPSWYLDPNDTNNVNALTPTKAILNGSDMIVIGGPIRFQNYMRGNVEAISGEMTDAYIKKYLVL